MKQLSLALLVLLSPSLAFAGGKFRSMSLEDWISWEKGVAAQKMRANIEPAGTHRGAVVASPQRENPDYYFHWIRDAALVMDVVLELSLRGDRGHWEPLLHSYRDFSRLNQLAHAPTGLGEPKFHVDGAPFTGPWGRPQNDGPALRAYTLTRWARVLLARHENIDSLLAVIRADLDYVADRWRDPSFDLWEEEKADHFFTRLSQWQSLVDGAALSDLVGDSARAFRYRLEARGLGAELELFWNRGRNQIDVSRNHREGLHYKTSQLDTAVLLAVLRAPGPLFPLQDPRVAATVTKLEASFQAIYPINQRQEAPGVALGRYPEDRYSGSGFEQGNPWVLCTLAAAEYYYRLASLRNAPGLLAHGDLFMERVKYHANPDGSLSEQMDRHSGYMTSARDLTWSYAAFLTATLAREDALRALHAKRPTEKK